MIPNSIITPALAMVALTSPTNLRVDPIARSAAFCSQQLAFGLPFGGQESSGMHMSATSSLVTLPVDFQPFSAAEVVVTLQTRRTHSVHGQADFSSEGQAQNALETIKASLVSRGWLAGDADASNQTNILYSEDSARNESAPKGLIAELFTLGSRLYFTCSDATLKQQSQKEWPQPAIASPAR